MNDETGQRLPESSDDVRRPGPDGEPDPRRRRRRHRLIALGIAAVLVLGFGAWKFLEHRIPAGTVIAVDGAVWASENISRAKVRLPPGELTLRTDFVDDVDPLRLDPNSTDHEIRPPVGGNLLGIVLFGSFFGARGADGAFRPITVDVEVDGERYPLPGISGDEADLRADGYINRRYVIGIADSAPSSVRITVTFDGVAQQIDGLTGAIEPGAAAGVYELDRFYHLGSGHCSSSSVRSPAAVRGIFDVSICSPSEPSRSVWLPDHGWSEPGRAWLTFRDFEPGDPTLFWASDDDTRKLPYSAARWSGELDVTFDGRPPVDRPADDCSTAECGGETMVFDVPIDIFQSSKQHHLRYTRQVTVSFSDDPDNPVNRIPRPTEMPETAEVSVTAQLDYEF